MVRTKYFFGKGKAKTMFFILPIKGKVAKILHIYLLVFIPVKKIFFKNLLV